MPGEVFTSIDQLIGEMRTAGWKERDALRDALLALASAHAGDPAVRTHLEDARKGLDLELRWEIDAVIEAITPKAPPPKKEEPSEAEPPKRPGQISKADLVTVYDDPRGLLVHRTKDGKRWFATQADPYSGQPVTFELSSTEIQTLKTQLAGSPYWVLGSGGSTP